MKFEPLLFFSALYNSQEMVLDYAEYDAETDNPFMGIYHFSDMVGGSEKIRTMWYDFYTNKYYDSIITLEGVKGLINENSYIDICYLLGGTIMIWVISSKKSNLIQPFYITTKRIELDLKSDDEWLKKKIRFSINSI